MKKKNVFYLFLFLFMCSCTDKDTLMESPDGTVSVALQNTPDGELKYTVSVNGQQVLEPSALGLVRKDKDFSKVRVADISDKRSVSDSYATPAEKKQQNSYTANEWDIEVENPQGNRMLITFHIGDKGVAFRYSFNEATKNQKVILRETTSFKLPVSARAWLHPHDDVKNCWAQTCPSYEDNYILDVPVGTPAPKAAGWSFPALFNVGEHWVLITESGLEPPYCGTRLGQNSPNGEYSIEFPQKGETVRADDPVTPVFDLPLHSPWRVIMLGGLADIVENTMVTDLAAPSKISDMSFVKPGIAAWSWGIEKDNSVNYKRQKQYIDYAAQMGWEYMLIDALWDTVIGYERMQELIDYATEKNVKVLVWYNSAGDWNTTYQTPKDRMVDSTIRKAEFERISNMGIAGIKVDFFPGDGPSAIQYYYDIMQDAAEYKLLLNFHGTTVPRGWSRTFPNLMTMEAIKGFEFITFSQETADLAAEHCAVAVFSRNVVGPMDFTPVCFGDIPGVERRTTNGFEIALTVAFQSGIQHYVETPEDMAKQPDYVQEYMKNIPRTWDDIKFIDGFPGKHFVVARKAGDKWYVGAINGENQTKELILDLSVLNVSNGYIITDGEAEREFRTEDVNLTDGKIKVEIRPNGGFVMVF